MMVLVQLNQHQHQHQPHRHLHLHPPLLGLHGNDIGHHITNTSSMPLVAPSGIRQQDLVAAYMAMVMMLGNMITNPSQYSPRRNPFLPPARSIIHRLLHCWTTHPHLTRATPATTTGMTTATAIEATAVEFDYQLQTIDVHLSSYPRIYFPRTPLIIVILPLHQH